MPDSQGPLPDSDVRPTSETAKKEVRATLVTHAVWAVVAILLTSALTVSVVNSFQNQDSLKAVKAQGVTIKQQGRDLKDALTGIRALSQQQLSCSSRQGQCYRDGLQRDADQATTILTSTYTALACAVSLLLNNPHTPSPTQIHRQTQACVIQQFQHQKR